jgi:two-component system, OmpR family, KDP operon response regulator KdpE
VARVLLIDDDPELLDVCRVGLEAFGHEIRTADAGGEGLVDAAHHPPDVIVLDLGLPDFDGLELCRRIRTRSDVPIVILSADGTEDRKVDALQDGADDYMTKPFGMRELDARLRVAIRHRHAVAHSNDQTHIETGALRLDIVRREATMAGERLDLTPREFEFLAYLARNAGQVCTRGMILENVWGPTYTTEHHYLKVYAYRLRRKLGDESGRLLQSDPAVGYRLADLSPAETSD